MKTRELRNQAAKDLSGEIWPDKRIDGPEERPVDPVGVLVVVEATLRGSSCGCAVVALRR
jgi:hypothetical protein